MSSPPPYPASFYAALHTGTDGDLAFYTEACSGTSSVLELGCGAGRVLEGLDVPHRAGLDLHDGLLQAAQTQLGPSVDLHALDMRTFELGRRFERILLPFSGVYCMLDDDDIAACFDRVRAHLEPGGVFILDAYRADGFHAECEPEDVGNEDWSKLTVIEVDGQPYTVFERSRWSPDTQRIDVTYRHVPLAQRTASVDGTIEQRYLLRHQLEGHLADAGLPKVEVFGGFDGRPVSRASEHWVAMARA
ncbi:MAG: class I SAM-dependent methyltransferase [Nannocystaceae bacterium]|nr:class I SAM-dependent methyltransferase [Nannocystaceae bacterium]